MFEAKYATATHRIRLPLPATEALELFTPRGERLWIAGWNPRYLHRSNGETMEGVVFTTGEGEELTFWTAVDLTVRGYAPIMLV